MSLDRPVNPFGRSESSRPSLPPDAPSDGLRRVASFPRVCVVFLGTPGALLDLFSPNKRTESSNSNIAKDSLTPTTFYVSMRCMERLSIFRLFRCWLRDLVFWYFFPENENAGGSAICIHKDLVPEEAIVTHWVTCDGRYHFVNIRSERHSLVFVNVHFEPELTLRQLRGRLGLLHPHWPAYPNGVGIILGDLNICDPEEGRFNVWNQTFTDGDAGKTAVFHSFFPYVLEIAQSDYTRKDSTSLGIMRTLSRIDRMYLWLRRETFVATPMSSRIWGTGPFRVRRPQVLS